MQVEDKEKVENSIEPAKVKRPKATFKLLLKLFYTSLYISAVAFGGGFVVLSLLQSTFVKKYKAIQETEMMDLYALAQASPGAIALNTAMLIGFRLAGILGALVTVIGSVIPPFAVITGFYYFYDAIKGYAIVDAIMRGMQAGVVGVIFSMIYDSCKNIIKGKSVFQTVVMILAFSVSFLSGFIFEISTVIYVMILSAVLGIGFSYISYAYKSRKGGKK